MMYLDADMAIIDNVGDEILHNVIAVLHPGYYNGGWGDKDTGPESMAYIKPENRVNYYAGGFQGGKTELYYKICVALRDTIILDEKLGVMAKWHDESHWNAYLSGCGFAINPLSPSYCMPEAQWKRELWGVEHFKPIILALEKEENIRE